jgi:pimeloyl-ACP methyl ester carboxylesterase
MGLLFLLFIGAAVWVAIGTLGILHRLTHPHRLTYGVAVGRNMPTSPADLGMTDFEEVTISLPDGQRTPAWVIKGQKPDGPLVVISHGWGHSRYGVLPWAKLYWPLASRVVLYDLRGQGESSASQTRLGTTEVKDLLEIVRQYHTPGIPVVLAGQSMGAGISIVAAASDDQPGRIVGVVGEGVYRLGMQPIEGYFKRKGWPLWPFWLFVAGHLSFWYTSARSFDRAAHAAKLKCPLLLFHAQGDIVCPVDAARQIAAAASDARLVEFEQGEHLNLVEVDEARYLAALREFFDRLPAAESRQEAFSESFSTGKSFA